jgi:hypothetical protein
VDIGGIDDQLADAGAGEDVLGEDGAGEQAADGQGQHGHGRQDRDPEGVVEDDLGLRQAEGPGGADMMLAHHLQHRGAHQAREIADPAQADGEARQDEMPELIAQIARLAGADDRKPVHLDGEDQQSVDGNDEGGDRDGADRDHPRQPVDPGIAADGRIAAQRNAQQGRPAQRGADQGQGIGQILQDDGADAPLGHGIGAEIARCRMAEEDPELDHDGPIQAHLVIEAVAHILGRAGAQHDGRHIAGSCGWRETAGTSG